MFVLEKVGTPHRYSQSDTEKEPFSTGKTLFEACSGVKSPCQHQVFFSLGSVDLSFHCRFHRGEVTFPLENLTEDLGFGLKRDCNAGVDNFLKNIFLTVTCVLLSS